MYLGYESDVDFIDMPLVARRKKLLSRICYEVLMLLGNLASGFMP